MFGRTLEDTNRERISILPRSTKKPRKAQKQKVNWKKPKLRKTKKLFPQIKRSFMTLVDRAFTGTLANKDTL